MTPNELARRRRILSRHIGENITFKREHTPRGVDVPLVGILLEVNRTRAVICFGEPLEKAAPWLPDFLLPPKPKPIFGVSGEWYVPIAHLLLPGSIEPAPGQMELFEGAAS